MLFRDKARPFKELNQDAAEFIALFEEDINKCSEALDHMLSDLFLESRRDSASDQKFLVTFSKKKYEIYKSTSSLLNELEEKWIKQISELKKKFVENTEIYLAGFKASTEVSSGSIDPLRRANISNRNRDNHPLRASDGGKIISCINTATEEEMKTDQRRNTREKNVDQLDIFSTPPNVSKVRFRKDTPNRVAADQTEISSTPPNVSKVRSRKGTPNRVAADRTVPDSKSEKMNVDSYIEASSSTGKTPKKVQFAVNDDDDLDSNFSEDSLAEFDARQKSMHNYLEEVRNRIKHSPEGEDYGEFISWKLKEKSEDPSEEIMPRSKDHQTVACIFEEILDFNPEKVMPKGRGRRKTFSSVLEENLTDMNPPEKATPRSRGGQKTVSRPNEDNLEDPSEEIMPRSKDHQTAASIFEENLDLNLPEKVMPKGGGRRKTISSIIEENLTDMNPPEKATPRSRGGQKTVSRPNEDNLEDPPEEIMPRSKDHQTVTSIFEEILDFNPEKVMPKGRGRRKTISSTLEENLTDLNPPEKATPKARDSQKTIYRTHEENLEDFNPFEKVTLKSSGRRKTISSAFEGHLEDMSMTLDTVHQTSFKRKSVSSLNVDPSPKKLKSGKRNGVASATKVKEEPVNNPLECDSSTVRDNYTQWVLLQDLGSNVSTKPGVYELKVWRAKKSAYIGSCENLHQKLELHKLGQSSGHKHLDKFLERNKNDVLVRYEEMPSFMTAKAEEKRRVGSFIALHKTTPAYN